MRSPSWPAGPGWRSTEWPRPTVRTIPSLAPHWPFIGPSSAPVLHRRGEHPWPVEPCLPPIICRELERHAFSWPGAMAHGIDDRGLEGPASRRASVARSVARNAEEQVPHLAAGLTHDRARQHLDAEAAGVLCLAPPLRMGKLPGNETLEHSVEE